MSENEKAYLMKDIVNLLAKSKCTVKDAEEILDGAKLGVKYSAVVPHLNY